MLFCVGQGLVIRYLFSMSMLWIQNVFYYFGFAVFFLVALFIYSFITISLTLCCIEQGIVASYIFSTSAHWIQNTSDGVCMLLSIVAYIIYTFIINIVLEPARDND